MSFWTDHVLPFCVEKACRSTTILEERKRWVPRARGDVLELGVGSGLNLAFYDPARASRVIGIDPSAALLARAAARVAEAAVPVALVRGRAEELPFCDASFDSVLVTYSLCSVDEPARVLAEVKRVLRSGGELVIVEHGLAPDATARWQRRLTPVWRRIAGNCHLDRDIAAILRDAGFRAELSAGYTDGAKFLSYTYQGTATTSA